VVLIWALREAERKTYRKTQGITITLNPKSKSKQKNQNQKSKPHRLPFTAVQDKKSVLLKPATNPMLGLPPLVDALPFSFSTAK